MKPVTHYIRYISLLFISGLMITLYIGNNTAPAKTAKHNTAKAKGRNTHGQTGTSSFSILNDVVGSFFPALKSQNNL